MFIIVFCLGSVRPRTSFLFRALFAFFPFSRLSSLAASTVYLSYFIPAVPMRECLGKHSCVSSTLLIAVLNGIRFFRQCNYKCTMCIRNEKVETFKQ